MIIFNRSLIYICRNEYRLLEQGNYIHVLQSYSEWCKVPKLPKLSRKIGFHWKIVQAKMFVVNLCRVVCFSYVRKLSNLSRCSHMNPRDKSCGMREYVFRPGWAVYVFKMSWSLYSESYSHPSHAWCIMKSAPHSLQISEIFVCWRIENINLCIQLKVSLKIYKKMQEAKKLPVKDGNESAMKAL